MTIDHSTPEAQTSTQQEYVRSDAGVIDTRHSPSGTHWFPPIHAVRLTSGFLQRFHLLNEHTVMPVLMEKLTAHGRLARYEIAAGKRPGPPPGRDACDADMGKWLEAAAHTMQYRPGAEIQDAAERLISLILDAQEPSGYLDTAFMGERRSLRYTNLRHGHELYVFGHLIMACIAHHRATGESALLNVATRLADHVHDVFVNSMPHAVCGHPGIEMALVELYRETKRSHYLHLARELIDRRGKAFPEASIHERLALVDLVPFRELKSFTGAHAVRAIYLACGATDVYLETGDKQLLDAVRRLWDDTTRTKMYITGAVGSRHTHESVGEAYELPNARAYAETCSAIGMVLWGQRMQAVEPRPEYVDVMETALYNCTLGGISLDGTHYFYTNPLATNPSLDQPLPERNGAVREPWYDCPCCPTNLVRLLASLPGYIYGLSNDGVYIHLYQASVLNWHTADGTPLQVEQLTDYPWSGNVDLVVTPAQACTFTVFLRIPSWCEKASIEVNGQPVASAHSGTYLALNRRWEPGDRVKLRMDMPPRYVEAHPRVRENTGCYALTRGPLVYCLEGVDNPGVSAFDVRLDATTADAESTPHVQRALDLLGDVVILHARGWNPDSDEREPLYRRAGGHQRTSGHSVDLTFIPYYARANRGPTWMKVWLPCR